MDAVFVPVAGLVGASVDQVKLISSLLLAYPLGSVFIRVPSDRPNLRHLFNIAVALFFFLPILGLYGGFLQLLADILVTYFVAKYVASPAMPWIVFGCVMGHLTVNHVIRAIYGLSYETVEITGSQMVLTMKLTTFAWNVMDGRRKIEDLDKWQAAKRIPTFPSLLEVLGYALYFPGVLVGPSIDFKDYMDLVNETLFRDEKDDGSKRRRIPKGRKRVGYRKMVKGLAFLGFYIFFGGSYNFSTTLTPEFAQKTLFHRILLFQGFGFCERAKYYAIWTLTEGACILTGHGFTGFSSSGHSLWGGAANVKVRKIEIPENFKVLVDSWNIKTNVWLREAVYKRVTPKGKKPGFKSSLITYGTSAFWHGIAAGYYMMFVSATFVTTAARLARANIRPLLQVPNSFSKRVYDYAGTILSIILLNYLAAPFMLLTIKDSILCWSRLGWYGHIIVGLTLGFFYGGGTKYLRSLQAQHGISSDKASTPMTEKVFSIPPALDKVIPPQK